MKPQPSIAARRWLLVLIYALGLCGAFPALASAQTATSVINVTTNDAVTDYPKGVNFHLAAASDASITHVELLYSLAASETEQLVEPQFTPGPSVDISASAGLAADYVPTGIEIVYHWRIVDADGVELDTAPQSILWEDGRFSWHSVSADGVTIYSYSATQSFQKTMIAIAQSAVETLKKRYGIDTLKPINVWVYNSQKDYNGTLEPNSQDWSAGTALPALQVVQAIIDDGDVSEANRLLPHELSHQVLNQATRNPFGALPLWLDEGLAVYNETADHSRYASLVESANAAGKLVSIHALISEFPVDSSEASLAYAESLSIATFLIDQYGEPKLRDLIHAFDQGNSYDDALTQAYGFDQDGLSKAWLASLDERAKSAAGAGLLSSSIEGLLSGGMMILLTAAGVGGVRKIRSSRQQRESMFSQDPGGQPSGGW